MISMEARAALAMVRSSISFQFSDEVAEFEISFEEISAFLSFEF